VSGRQRLACGPLSLGDIGSPFLPVLDAVAVFLQSLLLLGEVLVLVEHYHGGGDGGGGDTSSGWARVCGKLG